MVAKTPYDFMVQSIEQSTVDLSTYRGKVLLIVNVASQCGFTPQYRELEELYKRYGAQGLVVLGFPCNQFGGQEAGDSKQIAEFCSTRFQITFPLFEKIEVNGPTQAPLYAFLKKSAKGIMGTESIKWNFTKFLIDRQGKVLKRYAPSTKPQALAPDIEKALTETA